MAIQVSQAVMDGIEAVRVSGKTNMFDYNAVMKLTFKMKYYEAASWMKENKSKYAKELFEGFEVEK